MSIQSVEDLSPLIATSVIRGSKRGESHGGAYLIVPATREVTRCIDWNTTDIDWSGSGGDRGLRGIAFHHESVYIAAHDRILAFDATWQCIASYSNPYLLHCHEMAVHRDVLYVTSTAFDSILAFDLATKRFTWGLHVAKLEGSWQGFRFDPAADSGPGRDNRLHINSLSVDDSGLCFSGRRTYGVVALGAEARLLLQVELPGQTHNARLLETGVLFHDNSAGVLRYVARDGEQRQFRYPGPDADDLPQASPAEAGAARQGFGRGLCRIDERLFAAGSSPATVSVFDLDSGLTVCSVNFSTDPRIAIHGLEVWPHPLPARGAADA